MRKQHRKLAIWLALVMVATLSLTWDCRGAAAQDNPTPSLYERLGGVKPISMVVDDFINRLVSNETLNANPQIRAGRETSPDAYLKFRVTNQVCQAAGGPCQYTGLAMKDSHIHLKITEEEWQVMLTELKASLDSFKVPAQEQQELIAIVNSTKKDIVMTAAP